MIELLTNKIKQLGYDRVQITLIDDLQFGDFTTNVAMQYAKEKRMNPRQLAESIVSELGEIQGIEKIEIAGPGFINFWLSDDYLVRSVAADIEVLDVLSAQKVLVEHSSPNLFKPFHIGHTMNNIIGEAIAGLYRKSLADVTVVSYPSDVSLGIGKAVWALVEKGVETLNQKQTLVDKLQFLGECYVFGTRRYDEDELVQQQVRDITTGIYEQTSGQYWDAYLIGKNITLEYFKSITARLGSEFSDFIFESEAGKAGQQIVSDHMNDVFTASDGAVVYEGEQDGLHTRVFINSAGYPTYEAKDLGLIKIKFDRFKPDTSVVVTDAEQTQYFKVMLSAAGKINPDWQQKTRHITHGRMTFKGKRMSSRLGGIPTAEEVLDFLVEEVNEKAEGNISNDDCVKIAIAALKFSVLKSSPGSAVNFDPETSLSFEGDSGPYLQYSAVRIGSVLAKAVESDLGPELAALQSEDLELARLLSRYEIIMQQSLNELAPQVLVRYLLQLSQLFNSYYAVNKLIDADNIALSQHRLALITKIRNILIDGLQVLGIQIPEKM